jgi:hypothetical protein
MFTALLTLIPHLAEKTHPELLGFMFAVRIELHLFAYICKYADIFP